MTTRHLAALFERDLQRLADELNSYQTEANLWKVLPGTTNSAGVLAKHLLGNLNHFVGAVLGESGYIRDRAAEFANTAKPKVELLEEISELKSSISEYIGSLSPEVMDADYPIEVFGAPMNTTFFLIHLQGHLNYHLGQINYHRRTLEVDI